MNRFTPEQQIYIKSEVARRLKEHDSKSFDMKSILQGILFGLGAWAAAFAYIYYLKWVCSW